MIKYSHENVDKIAETITDRLCLRELWSTLRSKTLPDKFKNFKVELPEFLIELVL